MRERDCKVELKQNLVLCTMVSESKTVTESVANRFVESFQRAWDRVPESAKQVISKYFSIHPGRVYLCSCMDHCDDGALGRTYWCDGETVFTFLTPFVEHAGNIEGVVGVIAHELAHCFRRGSGLWSSSNTEEERNTRQLAKTWGFFDSPKPNANFRREIEKWRNKAQNRRFKKYTEKWMLGILKASRNVLPPRGE